MGVIITGKILIQKQESIKEHKQWLLHDILCFLFPLTVLFLSLSECFLRRNVGLLQDYGSDIVIGLFSFKGFFQDRYKLYMLFFHISVGINFFSKKVLSTAEHGYCKDTVIQKIWSLMWIIPHTVLLWKTWILGRLFLYLFFPREQPFILLFKMSFKNQRAVHKHSKV